MKFSKTDFPLLRWSLLIFFSSVLIGGIALYSSEVFFNKTNQQLHKAQNMDVDARNSLSAIREDRNNIAIYADEYGELRSNKIIGDEQRLDWIEGLDKLHRQNLVTDFHYSIAPQKLYVAQPPIASGNFDIHYSEMKLQFDLLHETQLVNFFSALRTQTKGHYQLESCALQRVSNAISDGTHAAATSTNLKAECSGGWITLKNRNSKT